jgi:hypothetical protein
MPFDPCGTRRLEGEAIIARLAAYLGVEAKDLAAAFIRLTHEDVKKGPIE